MTTERPNPSVSRPELLDQDGRDRTFWRMLYDLLKVGARMQDVRDRLAGIIGVTGPQYAILMAIAHVQDEDGGAGVRVIARRLHVSGPFITAQVNKLVAVGLVEKRENPKDGRGVILCLTGLGEQQLSDLTPEIQRANDAFFASLSRSDFDALIKIAERLVESSADALQ
ncbi:MAG: MarR family winged helix-turn-helix transcriptional regulator [Pseudomonadota bacterium]|nr:MarR family winged helix-turn-helix transcriptional regulator [Pseudomonadota bacterium]